MTWLISEKVQYVEVFVVLIELIEVVGLPLGYQNIANANVLIINVDEVQNSTSFKSSGYRLGSADLSSHIEENTVTKKRCKSVGKKPTPRKKRAVRPTFADGNEADGEDNVNDGANDNLKEGGEEDVNKAAEDNVNKAADDTHIQGGEDNVNQGANENDVNVGGDEDLHEGAGNNVNEAGSESLKRKLQTILVRLVRKKNLLMETT
ncbi:uncharacterized protein LOC108220664 [Daucus carota subsp. sativus]|uniref:uncharacterized protein LOC108220664 n=1 Tax=Daucus carota subsp. sativus TaxID=79200 RepID=UPI0007F012B7|nr:PREDICTED: S-antigen protein-like [Daucus carota subsp. sativus]